MKKQLKEFVIEKLVKGKWEFRSDHKNKDSAESNIEAMNKKNQCKVKAKWSSYIYKRRSGRCQKLKCSELIV